MSVNALQLYSQQSNGVTFSDPEKPDFTVRFKTTSNQKVIDGQRVTNYITEIAANDNHVVSVGSADASDALSVRIRTSGSLQSMDRLEQMLLDLAAKVGTWKTEKVFIGFNPVTPPQNTVA